MQNLPLDRPLAVFDLETTGIDPARDRVVELFSNLHPTVPGHGIVLTDDFNPLEYHDAANREETRRYLALNRKTM